jgi:hypothetical protein
MHEDAGITDTVNEKYSRALLARDVFGVDRSLTSAQTISW